MFSQSAAAAPSASTALRISAVVPSQLQYGMMLATSSATARPSQIRGSIGCIAPS